MAEDAPLELPLEEPAAGRHYALLCLLMLLVTTILLVERVPDIWSALPLLFGAALLVIQWREGPALVLFLVVSLLAAESIGGELLGLLQVLLNGGFRRFAQGSRTYAVFDDFLLAGALLIYAASYYRYLGFARHLFPIDTRVRPYGGLSSGERRRLLEEPQRRAPVTVTPREFGFFVLLLPLWLGGAAALWYWVMSGQVSRYQFGSALWAVVKLLYLFGVPLLLFRAGSAYSNQARAGRGESLQYLQDQLWRETRREQSRTNRWLTWARLRAQRRKEK